MHALGRQRRLRARQQRRVLRLLRHGGERPPVEAGLLDVGGGVIGLVVETGCRFFVPIAFPDRIDAGLRVAHLGRSSVRYEIAIFRNDEDRAAAQGHFVHVHVDRETRRPVPLPEDWRAVLGRLCAEAAP